VTVLRRGYVPVEPDPQGFDEKLREKFAKMDPGGKAGKQIGGQLNRALKRVNLDPIDIKADPKSALAKIELTEQRLRALSERAPTLEIKVAADRALAQLQRFRNQAADVGEDAGQQLGGRLNRALADLDLKPIDVDADPKSAIAAIEDTKRRLEDLSRDSATVEIRVKTQKALSDLAAFKRDIGELGDGAGASFLTRLGKSLVSSAAGSPMLVAGGVIGAALSPTIGAAIAGAVVGGAAAGGVVGGVVLAAKDERVKSAGAALGQTLLADLQRRASGFVTPVLNGIVRIRQGFDQMGPDLDRIFASSRFVEPLVDAAVRGARGFVSGFADAVDAADPVINALHDSIVDIGDAAGQFFRDMASQSKSGASAIRDVTGAITTVIDISGKIVQAAGAVRGWSDQVDIAIDKGRYWIEDNSALAALFEAFGGKLDLTADGFAAGSVQAEAYRKATTGVATATDFATLKQAGMTDAQIGAADASGRYRAQLDQVAASTRAVALANGQLVASEDDVKTAQQSATTAQTNLTWAIDHMNSKTSNAALLVDNLKKAATNLYGPTMAAADANDSWQASWDGLSESVRRNKGTLDNHTAAGRSNRDALKDLIARTNELYYAEINTGGSVAAATKKHTDRIAAVKEEARRVGLNKVETQKLINTYGQIPKKRTTDVVMDGMAKVVKALNELYIYQRSLAEGIPVTSVRALLTEKAGPQKRQGGYRDGGRTAMVSEDQPAGVVHGREFVFNAPTVRAIDRQAPGFLDEVHATGGLPGYRGGGYVAPVDTSRRWPYKIDAGATKIPSRKQVAAKVGPVFDRDWPSSPAAQRGDSGVWHKVVALIKSTGPLSGHFGNAYRPGDPLWHGSGRAVDWMGYNQDALATFLASKRPLELIHRTKHRDYAYTRGRNKGSFNNALMEAHRNHIHIAMANGGVIGEPVAGVGLRSGSSYSFGERGPETVTPGVGGGHRTYNINVTVPVGAHPAETGRQIVAAIQAFERGNGARWRQ